LRRVRPLHLLGEDRGPRMKTVIVENCMSASGWIALCRGLPPPAPW
jgi:hypothetical protein